MTRFGKASSGPTKLRDLKTEEPPQPIKLRDLQIEASSRPKQRTAFPFAEKWRDPRISLLLLLLCLSPLKISAQGCTQCRDNSAATSPQTQAAYRHAIILLVVTAGALFAGTVVLLRRSR